MKTNRRRFIATSLAGSLAATMPMSTYAFQGAESENPSYARLDEILKQPVLNNKIFTAPVIIQTLELLRYNDSFLCRVRSKEGAVGISVSNNSQMKSFYPVFVNH